MRSHHSHQKIPKYRIVTNFGHLTRLEAANGITLTIFVEGVTPFISGDVSELSFLIAEFIQKVGKLKAPSKSKLRQTLRSYAIKQKAETTKEKKQ
jgi:hypothetical protein